MTNAKVASSAAISADKLADGVSSVVMTANERTALASLSANNSYTASSGSGAWALAVNNSATFRRTLTGATTIDLSSATPSDLTRVVTLTLVLVQDATGSRAVTWTGIKWSYGMPPMLSTVPASIDVVTLMWAGGWLGFVSGLGMN